MAKGRWSAGDIALVIGGAAAFSLGGAILVRQLMDLRVIPLPPWMPMPLLPSWLPGIPDGEEGAEPTGEDPPSLLGAGMNVVTGYKAGKPIQVTLVSIGDGQFLEEKAAASFLAMRAAALIDGVKLFVNTSFRDMAFQQDLRTKYESKAIDPKSGKPYAIAAKPGYSNHQAGTAVDLATANGTNAAFRWLNKRAADFGFRRTVSSEPWHWEWFPPTVAAV